jgi:hypothetical protein
MIRNSFLNELDWNMKDWLLHTPMPPTQTPMPQTQNTRRKLPKTGNRPVFPRNNSTRSNTWTKKQPHPPPKPTTPPKQTSPANHLPPFGQLISPNVRYLPTDGLDENYMTKWLCGVWSRSLATEECYERALSNLNKIDFVFLTKSLFSDLPIAATLLGLNLTKNAEQVRFHLSHLTISLTVSLLSLSSSLLSPSLSPLPLVLHSGHCL